MNLKSSEKKDSIPRFSKLPTKTIDCESIGAIEFFRSGSGSPSVVFLNGFRMELSNWSTVINLLEGKMKGTLISYNRAGVGKTTKPGKAQTGLAVVQEMDCFLQCLGADLPVILVAHSLGGIFANLYARQYPRKVAAAVFVDSSHPDEIQAQKSMGKPFVINMLNEGIKSLEKTFSPYKFSEDEEIETTIKQIRQASDFPDIPLTVVTGRKKMPFAPVKGMSIHLECQNKLLDLALDSKQVFAEQSGHFPQINQPDLVANSIISIVNKVG